MKNDETKVFEVPLRVDPQDGEAPGSVPEVQESEVARGKKRASRKCVGLWPWFIYGLRESGSSVIEYVGYTSQKIDQRRVNHISAARASKRRPSKVVNWVKSVLNRNGDIEAIEIERGIGPGWEERERYWIAFYRALNPNIRNVASGGGFYPVHVSKPDQSLRQIGRKRPKEELDRMSISMKKAWDRIRASGRIDEIRLNASKRHASMSDDAKAEASRKMTVARTGKKPLPESIAKAWKTKKERGIVISDEHIAALLDGCRKWRDTPGNLSEYGRRRSLALTGSRDPIVFNRVGVGGPPGVKVVRIEDGVVFASIAEAARSIGVSGGSLGNAISRNGYCGGFRWKRADLCRKVVK